MVTTGNELVPYIPPGEEQHAELIEQVLFDSALTYMRRNQLTPNNRQEFKAAIEIVYEAWQVGAGQAGSINWGNREAIRDTVWLGLEKRQAMIQESRDLVTGLVNRKNTYRVDPIQQDNLVWIYGLPGTLLRDAHEELRQAEKLPQLNQTQRFFKELDFRQELLPVIAKISLKQFAGLDFEGQGQNIIPDAFRQSMAVRGVIAAYMAYQQHPEQQFPFPFNIDDQCLESLEQITKAKKARYYGKMLSIPDFIQHIATQMVNDLLLTQPWESDAWEFAERLIADYGAQILTMVENWQYSLHNHHQLQRSSPWEIKYRQLQGFPFEQFFVGKQLVVDAEHLPLAIAQGIPHIWQHAAIFGDYAVPSRTDLDNAVRLIKLTPRKENDQLIGNLTQAGQLWETLEKRNVTGRIIMTRPALISMVTGLQQKEAMLSRLVGKEKFDEQSGAIYEEYRKRLYHLSRLKSHYEYLLSRGITVQTEPRPYPYHLSEQEFGQLKSSLLWDTWYRLKYQEVSLTNRARQLSSYSSSNIFTIGFESDYFSEPTVVGEKYYLSQIKQQYLDNPGQVLPAESVGNQVNLRAFLTRWQWEIDHSGNLTENSYNSGIINSLLRHLTHVQNNPDLREILLQNLNQKIGLLERQRLEIRSRQDYRGQFDLISNADVNQANPAEALLRIIEERYGPGMKKLFDLQCALVEQDKIPMYVTPAGWLQAKIIQQIIRVHNNYYFTIDNEVDLSRTIELESQKARVQGSPRNQTLLEMLANATDNPLLVQGGGVPTSTKLLERLVRRLETLEAGLFYPDVKLDYVMYNDQKSEWQIYMATYQRHQKLQTTRKQIANLRLLLVTEENQFITAMNDLGLVVDKEILTKNRR